MFSFDFTHLVIIDFSKEEGKYCTEEYNSYTTIREAISECKLDNDCTAVYDNGCKGGTVALCHWTNSTIKASGQGSCIYRKPGKNSVKMCE